MTEQELLEQLDRWHEENRHREIVDYIAGLPEEQRLGYPVRCRLGRALNNVERYGDAIEVLESLRREGEGDDSWWSRMGYALYHLERKEESVACFRRALELNPANGDARTFLAWMNVGENGRENSWEGAVKKKKDVPRPATGNNGPARAGEAPLRQKPAGRGNDWQGRGWDDMDGEGAE